MTWFELLLACVAALASLAVPGVVLGLSVGLRGFWLAGASAPFAMTAIGLASLVHPIIGVPWGPIPVLIATAVLVAVVLALRFALRRWWGGERRAPQGAPTPTVTLIAIAIAVVALAVRSIQIVGEPGNISQTFDNIFHLNAVRFVLDTANASPLHLGSMTSENLWFYPASWHALAALVVDTTSVSVPVAVNAVWIVFSAAVWPVSLLLLVRTLVGSSWAVMLSAAVMAAGIPAFPYLMVDYGVLYPYHAGLALVPVAVAAICRLVRIDWSPAIAAESAPSDQARWGIVVLGSLPGIALLHPGAFVAVLALSAPVVVVAAIRAFRGARTAGRRWGLVAAVGIYLITALAAVRVLRPPAEASLWPPTGTAAQAIGEVVAVGLYGAETAILVAVLLVVGIIAVTRYRSAADFVLLGLFVVAGGLYVVVAGVENPLLRDLLTAPWYNNTPRLAAIVPIAAVPLAALGAQRVWAVVRGLLRASGRRWLVPSVGGVLLLAFMLSLQLGPMKGAMANASFSYALSPVSPLLSDDEMELLNQVPDIVPEDSAIAGSPWTGTSLAYAISDRRVLMPHTLMDTSDATDFINQELDEPDVDLGELCAAVDAENVGFVLDFGKKEVHGAEHPFPGLDRLWASDAVELVDRVGKAKLYRIVACG